MRGYESSSYGEAFADVYDEWYADVSDVDATVSLLRDLAGDGPFLELGVGTGRLAVALAATGAHVTGIDSSPSMLERLRVKVDSLAASTPMSLEPIHGHMVTDLPDRHFRGVVIAYNTIFSLGSVHLQRDLFTQVASRLEPTGVFVIEAAVPDARRPAGGTVSVKSLDVDRVVLSVDVHDPENQSVDGQFIEITESSGVRLRPWSIRYCTPAELDAMAEAAGLHLRDRWENVRREPFDQDSPTHVSVYCR